MSVDVIVNRSRGALTRVQAFKIATIESVEPGLLVSTKRVPSYVFQS